MIDILPDCPSAERLQALLTDDAPAADVAAHLEACPH